MPAAPATLRAAAATVAIALCLALGGCAKPAGPIFQPPDPALAWPPRPDTPRVFYIGELRGSADLKPARTFRQQMSDALFGKEPQHVLISPLSVCTDGADRVFIADTSAQLVHVMNLASRKYEQWRPPAGLPRLAQPVGVAWVPPGRLLVADAVNGNVVSFDSEGTYQGQFGLTGAFVRPCGLALDYGRRRIFIADPGAHQVVVMDLNGSVLERIGGRGTELGRFNFPTQVAVGLDGRVYVSDSLNFRVQIFSPELQPLKVVGSKGDMPGYFSQPKGLTVAPWGHLYVVDANFEAVQVFTAGGDLLMTFGREGRGPGEFWLPAGVFADGRNRIWVADSYNKRVQVFEYRPQEAQP